jgi:hypothetical protein
MDEWEWVETMVEEDDLVDYEDSFLVPEVRYLAMVVSVCKT